MISTTAVHAIRAVVQLASLQGDQALGAAQVAQKIHAPPNYLGKLLRILAQNGIVEARKGPGGGFRLARSARRISLFDVVQCVEQMDRWNACLLGQTRCSDEAPCAIHERWKPVRDAFLRLLADTTIEEILTKTDR